MALPAIVAGEAHRAAGSSLGAEHRSDRDPVGLAMIKLPHRRREFLKDCVCAAEGRGRKEAGAQDRGLQQRAAAAHWPDLPAQAEGRTGPHLQNATCRRRERRPCGAGVRLERGDERHQGPVHDGGEVSAMSNKADADPKAACAIRPMRACRACQRSKSWRWRWTTPTPQLRSLRPTRGKREALQWLTNEIAHDLTEGHGEPTVLPAPHDPTSRSLSSGRCGARRAC